ncbi:MAG TPA: tetratricopeptide repeat protein [Fimbriimonadaceae bacterium]|nr:tetratricopeptide repeat protein [Fimbriimonadaceae bacterium]
MHRTSTLCLGFLAILLLIFIGGCRRGPQQLLITSTDQYNEVLRQVFDLSRDPLATFEKGETLQEVDLKQLDRAESLTRSLIEFRPTIFTLYTLLGKILLAKGQTESALGTLQQAVRLAPKVTDVDIILSTADSYRWLAEAWLRFGDPMAAEGAAREALKRVEQNPDYTQLVASTLVQQKKYDEALKMLDQGLKISSQHYPSLRLKKFIESAQASGP